MTTQMRSRSRTSSTTYLHTAALPPDLRLNMRLSQWRWLGPIPASFLLQAVYGLLFADGVFVSILHDPVLTQAMGLAALFTSLGITAFGIVLHNATDPPVYRSAPRLIALLGALGIASQMIMAYALAQRIIPLVYLSAVFIGIGSGCIYVVSIVLLQDWVPEAPGMVTGTGLLFGGIGTLFGIYAFRVAAEAFGGALPAMALVGLISGALAAAASLLIQRPPTGWSPLAELDDKFLDKVDDTNFISIPVYSDETQSLLSHKQPMQPAHRVSITEILTDPAFPFVFISSLAAVAPGFGFTLEFPRMVNVMFGVDFIPANQMLAGVTLVGVIGRTLVGFVIDLFESLEDNSKYGFLSVKRVNFGVLFLQCVALALMPICIRYRSTQLFAFLAAMVSITFNGGAVLAACLARSVFSPECSTLAFALLGLAVGIGRAFFSVILASCGEQSEKAVESVASSHIYEYDMYVYAAFCVSLIGLAASYFVFPSKSANQNEFNKPVFTD